MLSITIVTLLITSNVISRIQAEEQREQKAKLNGMQTPVYEGSSVIEASKIQKRDTLNIVLESYVEQTNHVDKSRSRKRLRRASNFDNFMPDFDKKFSSFDAPSNRTGPTNYFGSRLYQKNNVYAADNGRQDILYGSQDVQIGNTFFSDNPNGTNVYGPILVQENNTYQGKNKNVQYGASVTQTGNRYFLHAGKNGVVVQNNNTYAENPGNKTVVAIIINQSNNTYPKSIEANKDALKPVIHQSENFYPSSNNSQARTNIKNNTESQVDSVKQNATDIQRNLSSTYYDSSSHIENKTVYNKEREAYGDKHTEPNKQMSLSSNVFYSLSYSFIILLKYSLLLVDK